MVHASNLLPPPASSGWRVGAKSKVCQVLLWGGGVLVGIVNLTEEKQRHILCKVS